MKEVVIKNIMLSIRNNTDYTEQKLNEIKYGLESLYLTLTKIGVIYVISIILRTYKELSLIFLFYGILRLTGFGIHAKSTKECWIASILVFVPFPYVKRPLIHKKKRIMYKVITTLLASIYTVIVIFTKNNILSNTLTFSIILEMAMVLPISYKLFGLTYNNYLNYKERRIN